METNPDISGRNGTSDLEARVGQKSGDSQGILSSVELHSENNTKRTFSVGSTYTESAVLMYMRLEYDHGGTALYAPSLNGNNISRLHFSKARGKGIFGQTKYVLKRIEEKTAEQNTTRKENIAVICNEHGDVCREFMPGGLYSLATLEQYLAPVNLCPDEQFSGKTPDLKIFETKLFNGNGHYYLFTQPNPIWKSYVFVAAVKKEAFDVEDNCSRGAEQRTAAR